MLSFNCLMLCLSSCFLAVKKLESGLLKLYLVTAFVAGKLDKITEFFSKLAPELHQQSEWREWFCMFLNEKKNKTQKLNVKLFINSSFSIL